jgi:hypothetical protein
VLFATVSAIGLERRLLMQGAYGTYEYGVQEGRSPAAGFYDPNQYDPSYYGQTQRQVPGTGAHRSVVNYLLIRFLYSEKRTSRRLSVYSCCIDFIWLRVCSGRHLFPYPLDPYRPTVSR